MSIMEFTPKRKRDEFEPDCKKIKNFIDETTREELTDSNEWPQYSHPDGGIVKITPWGSLRQFQDPITGETMTKFEDMSFSDYTFQNNNKIDDIYNNVNQQTTPSMPSTPQSLYQSQPTAKQQTRPYASHNMPRDDVKTPNRRFSPDCEAESYVRDGYQGITPPPPSVEQRHYSHMQQPQPQRGTPSHEFQQEHENYFGMNETSGEEFDCTGIGYSPEFDDDDDEMM